MVKYTRSTRSDGVRRTRKYQNMTIGQCTVLVAYKELPEGKLNDYDLFFSK